MKYYKDTVLTGLNILISEVFKTMINKCSESSCILSKLLKHLSISYEKMTHYISNLGQVFNIITMFTGASELLSGPHPHMMKGSWEPVYTEHTNDFMMFSKSNWFII